MSWLQRGGRVGSSPGVDTLYRCGHALQVSLRYQRVAAPARLMNCGCFPGRASISPYRSVDLSLLKESKSEWRCLGLIAGDEWSLSAAQERAAVQTESDILLELGVNPICLEQIEQYLGHLDAAAEAKVHMSTLFTLRACFA
ncbi:uncharacterized protein LOC114022071 isoform X3 [Chelonia mydas]|uniref:uncharacterized protein LOC114022071 isoform X3 n=1 Tax=Chelonia mydas TaxID=8469 RepID=UPI001CAA289F|nr:uncharacterized protein LOC114022071 isoform X3 [Chelonia mydas]